MDYCGNCGTPGCVAGDYCKACLAQIAAEDADTAAQAQTEAEAEAEWAAAEADAMAADAEGHEGEVPF